MTIHESSSSSSISAITSSCSSWPVSVPTMPSNRTLVPAISNPHSPSFKSLAFHMVHHCLVNTAWGTDSLSSCDPGTAALLWAWTASMRDRLIELLWSSLSGHNVDCWGILAAENFVFSETKRKFGTSLRRVQTVPISFALNLMENKQNHIISFASVRDKRSQNGWISWKINNVFTKGKQQKIRKRYETC